MKEMNFNVDRLVLAAILLRDRINIFVRAILMGCGMIAR